MLVPGRPVGVTARILPDYPTPASRRFDSLLQATKRDVAGFATAFAVALLIGLWLLSSGWTQRQQITVPDNRFSTI